MYVPVEQACLTDSRYDILAKLAGWANRHEALGRMVRLWNECQERETYTLTPDEIEALLGCHPDHLIKARLGRHIGSTRQLIYVSGTKGRIEAIQSRRNSNKERQKRWRERNALRDVTSRVSNGATQSDLSRSGKASASSEASTKRTTPDRSELLGFARAWAAYPHYGQRSRKDQARKVWIKRGLEAHTESVLHWIEVGSPDWKREAGRFVPGMQVWLAGPEFSEEPAAAPLPPGLDQERLDMYRNLGRKP